MFAARIQRVADGRTVWTASDRRAHAVSLSTMGSGPEEARCGYK